MLAQCASVVLFHRSVLETDSLVDTNLSSSLFRLTTTLSLLRRKEDSCVVRQEAIHLYRRAYETNPARYQLDFVRALYRLGNDLRYLEIIEQACVVRQECAALLCSLSESNPPVYHHALIGVLCTLRAELIVLGRHDEAAAVAEEWLASCTRTHGIESCPHFSIPCQCDNDLSAMNQHRNVSSVLQQSIELEKVPR